MLKTALECYEILNLHQQWQLGRNSLPKAKAVGGSNDAIVFSMMACPLLVRKKRYRGISAAKRTKGATIAASLDLEKNTDKKKPAMLKTMNHAMFNANNIEISSGASLNKSLSK